MNKLTLKQLTKLIDEYKDLDEACTAARKAGCLEVEGRLQNSIWSLIETAISFFDPEGWIMWYILENEYGAKGYDAGYKGDMKPIKTPEDLLQLMNRGTEIESDNLKKELQDAICKVRELEMQIDIIKTVQY
jgi:hypothetical protein